MANEIAQVTSQLAARQSRVNLLIQGYVNAAVLGNADELVEIRAKAEVELALCFDAIDTYAHLTRKLLEG